MSQPKTTYKNLLVEQQSDIKQNRFDFLYQMVDLQQQIKGYHSTKKSQRKTLIRSVHLNLPYQIHHLGNKLPFLERQKLWAESKQQKIVTKREKDINKDLLGCTFQPELRQQKLGPDEKSILEPLSTQTHTSQLTLQSIESFLKRQMLGRAHKREHQILLDNPYSHLSAEKKGIIGRETSNITHAYESRRQGERVEFSMIVQSAEKANTNDSVTKESPEGSDNKVSLGTAIKLLHQELHNITFSNQFN